VIVIAGGPPQAVDAGGDDRQRPSKAIFKPNSSFLQATYSKRANQFLKKKQKRKMHEKI